jgi:hypothetical protein
VVEGIVERVEGCLVLGFAVKRLHDAVAGEYFFDMPVYVAQIFLLPAVVFLGLSNHEADYSQGYRNDDEGDGRHEPTYAEHHDKSAQYAHHGDDHLGKTLVQCLIDSIHVVGHSR